MLNCITASLSRRAKKITRDDSDCLLLFGRNNGKSRVCFIVYCMRKLLYRVIRFVVHNEERKNRHNQRNKTIYNTG